MSNNKHNHREHIVPATNKSAYPVSTAAQRRFIYLMILSYAAPAVMMVTVLVRTYMISQSLHPFSISNVFMNIIQLLSLPIVVAIVVYWCNIHKLSGRARLFESVALSALAVVVGGVLTYAFNVLPFWPFNAATSSGSWPVYFFMFDGVCATLAIFLVLLWIGKHRRLPAVIQKGSYLISERAQLWCVVALTIYFLFSIGVPAVEALQQYASNPNLSGYYTSAMWSFLTIAAFAATYLLNIHNATSFRVRMFEAVVFTGIAIVAVNAFDSLRLLLSLGVGYTGPVATLLSDNTVFVLTLAAYICTLLYFRQQKHTLRA